MRVCYHTSDVFNDGANEDGVTEYSVCKYYMTLNFSLCRKPSFSKRKSHYDGLARWNIAFAWLRIFFGFDYNWVEVCQPHLQN